MERIQAQSSPVHPDVMCAATCAHSSAHQSLVFQMSVSLKIAFFLPTITSNYLFHWPVQSDTSADVLRRT